MFSSGRVDSSCVFYLDKVNRPSLPGDSSTTALTPYIRVVSGVIVFAVSGLRRLVGAAVLVKYRHLSRNSVSTFLDFRPPSGTMQTTLRFLCNIDVADDAIEVQTGSFPTLAGFLP